VNNVLVEDEQANRLGGTMYEYLFGLFVFCFLGAGSRSVSELLSSPTVSNGFDL